MPPQYEKYTVKHIQPQTADGIFTLCLAPQQGAVPAYKAGQFFMIRNDNLPEGVKPRIKPYSAMRAHRTDELSFGVKVHGDFSTGLSRLQAGQSVECSGPYGFFTMADGERELVLLAGGIGITPLLCMLEELARGGTERQATLIYSNRSQIAYKDLLDSFAQRNPRIKIVYTLTAPDVSGWEGERGRIGMEMIRKHVPQAAACGYYMCGTKEFIAALTEALIASGVPKERVHSEKW